MGTVPGGVHRNKVMDKQFSVERVQDAPVGNGRGILTCKEVATEKAQEVDSNKPKIQPTTRGDDFLGGNKTMNSALAAPQEFISIDQAAQMSGWSKAWIIRRMNEFGATRIGQFFLRDEFISYFRERARRRQQRILGRSRPMVMLPKPSMTRASSARELVSELLRKEGP